MFVAKGRSPVMLQEEPVTPEDYLKHVTFPKHGPGRRAISSSNELLMIAMPLWDFRILHLG